MKIIRKILKTVKGLADSCFLDGYQLWAKVNSDKSAFPENWLGYKVVFNSKFETI